MSRRFTLAQIEAFYWIARLRTFQKAAKQLNLSQPTVSLRVRDLERALGARLFERVGRGIRLSHDGAALHLHHAGSTNRPQPAPPTTPPMGMQSVRERSIGVHLMFRFFALEAWLHPLSFKMQMIRP